MPGTKPADEHVERDRELLLHSAADAVGLGLEEHQRDERTDECRHCHHQQQPARADRNPLADHQQQQGEEQHDRDEGQDQQHPRRGNGHLGGDHQPFEL